MRKPMTRSAGIVAALVLVVAACSGTAAASATTLWPPPAEPMDRAVAAGLVPEAQEHLAYHVHAHLDIFVDGERIIVPAGIGIDITDPDVQEFAEADGSTSYGGIRLCTTPCISPLHTHARFGILHTESATPKPNTLGQFFIEWGLTISDSCVGELCPPDGVASYINGELSKEDPAAIELSDGREIAIIIGTPPPQIPSTADFTLL